jgi:hypothetical protein
VRGLTGAGCLSSVERGVRALGPLLLVASVVVPLSAEAHDLKLQLDELERGVNEIGEVLDRLEERPAIPRPPRTRGDHLRILGEAEIEHALGNDEAALRKLLGRISDSAFRKFPEYISALLLAAQILEDINEPTGAMLLSRLALEQGGSPGQMAEAGARWFRIARRQERLEDRSELLSLWQTRGGAGAAGVELAAEAAYEAAFALRLYEKRAQAQQLLASIPAESRYGSRAAYLAGVIFVESGDLANAERWFSAIMQWPIPPSLDDKSEQQNVEREIRQLAALSAGRLRYEKGDLDGADEAYGLVPEGSVHQVDACYERAFLALERKRRRGALVHLQCVIDLGPRGERAIDVRLARASLLAHLARYSESVEAYETLHEALALERTAVVKALASVESPAKLLFDAMERNAVREGKLATPGPAMIFGDTWTPEVDHAYRLDRDVDEAKATLFGLLKEIRHIQVLLDRVDAFAPLENRRRAYRQILREIQHLQGHAGDLVASAREGHAALVASNEPGTHVVDRSRASEALATLDRRSREVEAKLVELDHEEQSRRAQATTTLSELTQQIELLGGVAAKVEGDVDGAADRASRTALAGLQSRYDHAVMRAAAGVLDTFWIRKEHLSDKIRVLGLEQERIRDEYDAAIKEASSSEAR